MSSWNWQKDILCAALRINLLKRGVKEILEQAGCPSAVNFQPVQFIVIQKKELKEQVWEYRGSGWQGAGNIAICGDHRESWRRADGKDHRY